MGEDVTVTSTIDPIEAARGVLTEEIDASDVGDHLGSVPEGEHVTTQLFACTRRGYAGWHWSVTMVALPGEAPTVDEVVLIPGAEAIVAPPWVPYRERIKPGDLSPGDLLPVADDDPRLALTYSFGEDDLDAEAKAQVRQVAGELGLGRARTLSLEGIDLAAKRWYAGSGGPEAPLAQAAPDHCYSCGFLMRLSGHLAPYFGVCANGDANDDGKVVSMDHGCGAHSEVRLAKRHEPQPLPDPVWDTISLDLLESF